MKNGNVELRVPAETSFADKRSLRSRITVVLQCTGVSASQVARLIRAGAMAAEA
jgi:hypothetical protein